MADSTKEKCLKSGRDIIGALPDNLLHDILSFLDMEEVVGTSLISKRWRYMWISVPVLNFSHSQWKKKSKNGKSDVVLKNKFMKFVDKVLFLHNDSQVTKFKFSCSSAYYDSNRFGAWMTVAARKQFHEINIEIDTYGARANKSRELPVVIFSSGVTVFKLKFVNNSHRGPTDVMQIPNLISSTPQLKTLVLHSAELPKGCSDGEFVLSCPVLQNLELINCEMGHLNILNICTLQLKKLLIQNIFSRKIGSCQIKISTPNLESLELSDCVVHSYTENSFANLKCLKILNAKHLEDWKKELELINLCHLKSLEIGFIKGRDFELNILRCLLNNAVLLEKLTIRMKHNVKEDFVRYIYSLRRASTCRIVFFKEVVISTLYTRDPWYF